MALARSFKLAIVEDRMAGEPRLIGGAMIGQRLGSFRIDARLGGDAVYRAVDETTGRTVAIKVLRGEQEGTLARFQHVADMLQQFRHPNVVRFLGLGRYQGAWYVAREYIAGPTLAQVLAERGALPWPEVVGLGLQICEALRYIHQCGVVHRNLKPSHLLLAEQGRIKLIGFGLAKSLDLATPLATFGRLLGTPHYMAPEQIRGTPAVSHKTDLYALGAVLCEMLTGLPPFEGTSALVLMHRHLNEPPPRPISKVPGIPVALDGLIMRLMAKAARDRPWDAAEVANGLSQLRDDELQKPVNKAQLSPLRHPLWRWLYRGEHRQIAGDASPDRYLEDMLWDRDLDA
jgi:eukaryotic-like serine/threonine-protein kinase